MAVTYTRKAATAVAVNDKVSAMTVQNSGGRVYRYDSAVDDRPTVTAVKHISAPNTDSGNEPTGPVVLSMTGGAVSSASPQDVVLAESDSVVVSTGTP